MAYRKEKLEELIKRIVADLLIKDIKDPRIGFATITGVTLNKDFTEARVGISVYGESKEMWKTLEGLRSATGYIQHKVGKGLSIRNCPKIIFFLDSSLVEGVKMVGLLNELEKKESGAPKEDDDDSGDDE